MTDPYAETDTWPNPPASQQPARPATLAASEASRVLGEGSDAQEAREAAYARACGAHSWHATTERFRQTTRAVMAVADAERNEAYARGYQTAREHWKARAEAAEAGQRERMNGAIDRVRMERAQAEDAETVATERAESAERARDAALAEVAELRDRLGRVEALAEAVEATPANVERLCEVMHDAYERAATGAGWETNLASRKPWASVPEANRETMRAAVFALLLHVERRATLAVPVTGDTEDASPAAEDVAQGGWERHVSTRCPRMAEHGRIEVVDGRAVNLTPHPCPDCYSIESFWHRIPWEKDGRWPASAPTGAASPTEQASDDDPKAEAERQALEEYRRTHSADGYPLGSAAYPNNRQGRRALARTWKRVNW